MSELAAITAPSVQALRDIHTADMQALLARFGMVLTVLPDGQEIPGSYWGECEAGLMGNVLYCRPDTPVHSILHEACHFICMDSARRAVLVRDAGGDFAEEDAVCYLQILLADHVPGMGRQQMCHDMDAWGYTFRLGSAAAWFTRDAADAAAWLQRTGLVQLADLQHQPTWIIRT